MRLVLREKRSLKEQGEINKEDIGKTFNYKADIDPISFLKLTTPKSEAKFYDTFLKMVKGQKDLEKIKEIFLSMNPDPLENVAHNVTDRAIKNLLAKGFFDQSMAGRSSLSVMIRPYPYVENHEGRARVFMKMISDAMNGKKTKSIEINLITDNNSWENLETQNKEAKLKSGEDVFPWVMGQKLAGEKGEAQKISSIQNVKRA